jgi:hypothetical protein
VGADPGLNVPVADLSLAQAGLEVSATLSRIQQRNDGLALDREDTAFTNEALAAIREAQATSDLADDTVIESVRQRIEQAKAQALERFQGSPSARAKLAIQLDRRITGYQDQLGVLNINAANQQLDASIKRRINEISAEDGLSVAGKYDALEKTLDFINPPPNQRQAFRDAGREALAAAEVTKLLRKNAFGAARRMMDDPAFSMVFTPAVREQLESRIDASEQLENKAIIDARNKVRAFEAIVGRPPNSGERLDLAGISQIPSAARSEFERNVKSLAEMELAGDTDSNEYKLIAARVAKQTQLTNEGVAISFNPDDGTFTVVQGTNPAQGLGATLSGAQALNEKKQLDRIDTTINLIDSTLTIIREDPSTAGVLGQVKDIAQRIVGVAADTGADALATAILDEISGLPGLDDEQKRGLGAFFDPTLPETQIYQNTIALELAKLRVVSGGGGIRAIESAFKTARDDVNIRGLFSSKDAATRLQAVRNEFATERQKLVDRLGGGTAAPPIQEGQLARTPDGRLFIFRDGEWEEME